MSTKLNDSESKRYIPLNSLHPILKDLYSASTLLTEFDHNILKTSEDPGYPEKEINYITYGVDDMVSKDSSNFKRRNLETVANNAVDEVIRVALDSFKLEGESDIEEFFDAEESIDLEEDYALLNDNSQLLSTKFQDNDFGNDRLKNYDEASDITETNSVNPEANNDVNPPLTWNVGGTPGISEANSEDDHSALIGSLNIPFDIPRSDSHQSHPSEDTFQGNGAGGKGDSVKIEKFCKVTKICEKCEVYMLNCYKYQCKLENMSIYSAALEKKMTDYVSLLNNYNTRLMQSRLLIQQSNGKQNELLERCHELQEKIRCHQRMKASEFEKERESKRKITGSLEEIYKYFYELTGKASLTEAELAILGEIKNKDELKDALKKYLPLENMPWGQLSMEKIFETLQDFHDIEETENLRPYGIPSSLSEESMARYSESDSEVDLLKRSLSSEDLKDVFEKYKSIEFIDWRGIPHDKLKNILMDFRDMEENKLRPDRSEYQSEYELVGDDKPFGAMTELIDGSVESDKSPEYNDKQSTKVPAIDGGEDLDMEAMIDDHNLTVGGKPVLDELLTISIVSDQGKVTEEVLDPLRKEMGEARSHSGYQDIPLHGIIPSETEGTNLDVETDKLINSDLNRIIRKDRDDELETLEMSREEYTAKKEDEVRDMLKSKEQMIIEREESRSLVTEHLIDDRRPLSTNDITTLDHYSKEDVTRAGKDEEGIKVRPGEYVDEEMKEHDEVEYIEKRGNYPMAEGRRLSYSTMGGEKESDGKQIIDGEGQPNQVASRMHDLSTEKDFLIEKRVGEMDEMELETDTEQKIDDDLVKPGKKQVIDDGKGPPTQVENAIHNVSDKKDSIVKGEDGGMNKTDFEKAAKTEYGDDFVQHSKKQVTDEAKEPATLLESGIQDTPDTGISHDTIDKAQLQKDERQKIEHDLVMPDRKQVIEEQKGLLTQDETGRQDTSGRRVSIDKGENERIDKAQLEKDKRQKIGEDSLEPEKRVIDGQRGPLTQFESEKQDTPGREVSRDEGKDNRIDKAQLGKDGRWETEDDLVKPDRKQVSDEKKGPLSQVESGRQDTSGSNVPLFKGGDDKIDKAQLEKDKTQKIEDDLVKPDRKQVIDEQKGPLTQDETGRQDTSGKTISLDKGKNERTDKAQFEKGKTQQIEDDLVKPNELQVIDEEKGPLTQFESEKQDTPGREVSRDEGEDNRIDKAQLGKDGRWETEDDLVKPDRKRVIDEEKGPMKQDETGRHDTSGRKVPLDKGKDDRIDETELEKDKRQDIEDDLLKPNKNQVIDGQKGPLKQDESGRQDTSGKEVYLDKEKEHGIDNAQLEKAKGQKIEDDLVKPHELQVIDEEKGPLTQLNSGRQDTSDRIVSLDKGGDDRIDKARLEKDVRQEINGDLMKPDKKQVIDGQKGPLTQVESGRQDTSGREVYLDKEKEHGIDNSQSEKDKRQKMQEDLMKPDTEQVIDGQKGPLAEEEPGLQDAPGRKVPLDKGKDEKTDKALSEKAKGQKIEDDLVKPNEIQVIDEGKEPLTKVESGRQDTSGRKVSLDKGNDDRIDKAQLEKDGRQKTDDDLVKPDKNQVIEGRKGPLTKDDSGMQDIPGRKISRDEGKDNRIDKAQLGKDGRQKTDDDLVKPDKKQVIDEQKGPLTQDETGRQVSSGREVSLDKEKEQRIDKAQLEKDKMQKIQKDLVKPDKKQVIDEQKGPLRQDETGREDTSGMKVPLDIGVDDRIYEAQLEKDKTQKIEDDLVMPDKKQVIDEQKGPLRQVDSGRQDTSGRTVSLDKGKDERTDKDQLEKGKTQKIEGDLLKPDRKQVSDEQKGPLIQDETGRQDTSGRKVPLDKIDDKIDEAQLEKDKTQKIEDDLVMPDKKQVTDEHKGPLTQVESGRQDTSGRNVSPDKWKDDRIDETQKVKRQEFEDDLLKPGKKHVIDGQKGPLTQDESGLQDTSGRKVSLVKGKDEKRDKAPFEKDKRQKIEDDSMKPDKKQVIDGEMGTSTQVVSGIQDTFGKKDSLVNVKSDKIDKVLFEKDTKWNIEEQKPIKRIQEAETSKILSSRISSQYVEDGSDHMRRQNEKRRSLKSKEKSFPLNSETALSGIDKKLQKSSNSNGKIGEGRLRGRSDHTLDKQDQDVIQKDGKSESPFSRRKDVDVRMKSRKDEKQMQNKISRKDSTSFSDKGALSYQRSTGSISKEKPKSVPNLESSRNTVKKKLEESLNHMENRDESALLIDTGTIKKGKEMTKPNQNWKVKPSLLEKMNKYGIEVLTLDELNKIHNEVIKATETFLGLEDTGITDPSIQIELQKLSFEELANLHENLSTAARDKYSRKNRPQPLMKSYGKLGLHSTGRRTSTSSLHESLDLAWESTLSRKSVDNTPRDFSKRTMSNAKPIMSTQEAVPLGTSSTRDKSVPKSRNQNIVGGKSVTGVKPRFPIKEMLSIPDSIQGKGSLTSLTSTAERRLPQKKGNIVEILQQYMSHKSPSEIERQKKIPNNNCHCTQNHSLLHTQNKNVKRCFCTKNETQSEFRENFKFIEP